MRYIVIYDITDDALRLRVSETLKDYGLARIQYSAFLGFLTRDRLSSLMTDLRRMVGEAEENVQLYPLCDVCFKGRREVGKPKRYEYSEKRLGVAYF